MGATQDQEGQDRDRQSDLLAVVISMAVIGVKIASNIVKIASNIVLGVGNCVEPTATWTARRSSSDRWAIRIGSPPGTRERRRRVGVEVWWCGKWREPQTGGGLGFSLKLCSAVTYSPTPSRVQYHRRWQA